MSKTNTRKHNTGGKSPSKKTGSRSVKAVKSSKSASGKKASVSRSSRDLRTFVIIEIISVLLLILFLMVYPGSVDDGFLLIIIVKAFNTLFGGIRFLFPFYLGVLGLAFNLRRKNSSFSMTSFIVFESVLFLSIDAIACLNISFVDFSAFIDNSIEFGGGFIGGIVAYLLLSLTNKPVSYFLLIVIALVSLYLLIGPQIVNNCFARFVSVIKQRRENKKENSVDRGYVPVSEEDRKKARRDLKKQRRVRSVVSEKDNNEADEKSDTLSDEYDAPEDDIISDTDDNLSIEYDGVHDTSESDNNSVVENIMTKIFSGKSRSKSEKKPKSVQYVGKDKVIVDGVVFVKDYVDDDYQFEKGTLAEELNGAKPGENCAPEFNGNDEPPMDLKGGLVGGYGEDDFSAGLFSVEELDKDDDDNTGVSEVSDKTDKASDDNDAVIFGDLKKKNTAVASSESMTTYKLPGVQILSKGKHPNQASANREVQENAKKLEKTLASFGVAAKVTNISCGPSLVRYEVQPGQGVKVSRIVSLSDDIALQLAATGIRIEAPIPGKSVVGIEVPRKEKSPVYFRDILEKSDFFKSKSRLTCAYGQDIAGNPIIGDLASMPHLLIAGTTGSGKSVCMNTMICSILFKATPDQVKFIMIDPKQVEFVIYEGLPHLITPVVTDPRKAAGALKWALREMENRYTLFNQNRVRNLAGYNKLIKSPADKLPQIVIFIDELADLMMVAAKEVEASICRLAQKARAAGIHLVIATQRPSVDVITGLIKANIPSRIALSVSSQTDSRTILDVGGAEKLLGHGDMLYLPIGVSKPIRIQGAWLSDEDAVSLLDFYKKQGEPDYIEGVAKPVDDDVKKNNAELDPLFYEAAEASITAGQMSTSMLQRRFRIGYNHAARIMEELEENGVLGPAEGSRPRRVLVTLEVFRERFPKPEEHTLFD